MDMRKGMGRNADLSVYTFSDNQPDRDTRGVDH